MGKKKFSFASAYLGNLFEHYETALFGFLSPFLAPLIFPKQDPLTALILTYAMIPLGMVARPIGALVFGWIGDVYGRGRALFFTLVGMSLISGCIVFSPTYSQVGIWAPFLFCLGRILQNFFAAGETMGGAIFLLENISEKRRDFLSSLYDASTMGGHLLASLAVFLLSQHQLINPGWRFLYLAGCCTALFGAKMRRALPSTPIATPLPLKETLWTYRKPLFCIILCSGFAYASYSMALILINGLIPLVSPWNETDAMQLNTYLVLFDFCCLPFFGWLAFKISRERLMLYASLGAFLFALPLFAALPQTSFAGLIAIRMVLVLFGVAFCAPFRAWAASLVPPQSRCLIVSLGYALGSQLLGSPTSALALWCFQKTAIVSSVAWYWAFLGLASSVALIYSKARSPRLVL